MIKTCVKCGIAFETKTKRVICQKCIDKSKTACPQCGKIFVPSVIHGKLQECCSISCSNKYRTKKDGYVSSWAKESVKEKIKQTNLERRGAISPLCKGTDSRKKIEQTNLNRYGSISPASAQSVRDKLKATIGNMTSKQKAEIRSKIESTFLENYGETNPMKIKEIAKRTLETKRKRYGSHLEGIVEKTKQNNLERLGVFKPEQSHLPDELKQLIVDKEASVEFLSRGWTMPELFDHFGGYRQAILSWIKRFNLSSFINFSKSYLEKSIGSFLPGFKTSRKALVLDKQYREIDLYSEQLKVGVEVNGNYWHSDMNVSKYYHYEKSRLAEKLGIRLVHIYEYEWNDDRVRPILLSIFSIIRGTVENKIYARQCEIKEISNKEAEAFSNKNHLQGHRPALITLGLFYQNRLVQLMSFSHHSKYQWEIIRGCPGSNNLVVGGVSKLFSHFVKTYNPDTVFSYCDFNKFDGKGYEAIGMKFIGYTGPDKTWLIDGKAIKRNPHRYRDLKDASEAIIWGSGSKKYLWTKQ